MLVAQNTQPISLLGPVNRLHPLNRGLVAWYLALPGLMGGLKWHDLCNLSSGNHGTLTSMDPKTDWISPQGRPGGFGAMDFDGSNDSVRIAHNSSLPTTNFTMVAWANVRSAGGGSNGRLLSKRSANQQYDWLVTPVGNQFNTVAATTAPGTGIWRRLGVTFDGTTIRHYMDGNANGSGAGTVVEDATTGLWIGDLALASRAFDGFIDDVRLINRVWSESDFASDFLLSKQGNPGLLNRIWIPRYTEQGGAGASVSATLATIEITGLNASVSVGTNVSATLGSIELAGFAASVSVGANIDSTTATLQITPLAADVTVDSTTTINATTATSEIAPLAASVSVGVDVHATLATAEITGLNPSVSVGTTINSSLATIEATGLSASVSSTTTISANVATVEITGLDASVSIEIFSAVVDTRANARVFDTRASARQFDTRANTR